MKIFCRKFELFLNVSHLSARRWAVLFVVTLLALTLYYGVIFQGSLPDHPILRGKNDLFLHFTAFMVLSVPVWLLWPRWLSFGALVFCAALIEVIQIFQMGRSADIIDFIASAMGVMVGIALVALFRHGIHRILRKKHEQ